jgi:hypothetical protein
VRLPGWVIEDTESVRQEVSGLRDTTLTERWSMALACARDALWALAMSDRAERALAHQDPLPQSTIVALQRLRKQAGWGTGDS